MKTIADVEAGVRMAELLEQVAGGETVVITRQGREVARLVPPPAPTVDEVIDGLRAARKGVTLGGLSVRDLINEGRR